VSLPDEALVLDADLTRLAQVFGNLLNNSAKYTPPGGRISLIARHEGAHVVVSVKDTGAGIPASSIAHVFDMFSQVDRPLERASGGLGIGLALVKGLVEAHGGDVRAESAGEGAGSTFTVRLPLAPALSPVPAAEGGETAEPPRAHDGKSVLVVDDNRDGALAMASLLSLLGYRVHLAYDGVEALEVAEREHPNAVLMDVGLPRLNGLETTRRLRERPWARSIPIIALTGWGHSADREKSREAGCDQHLVKPVGLPELEAALAKA
jgi:CheY-like chemotaxis protein